LIWDIKTSTAKDREQQIKDLMDEIKIVTTGRDNLYTILYSHENPKLAKDVSVLFDHLCRGSLGDKKQDSASAVHFIEQQIKTYEEKLVAAENTLKEFKRKNIGLLPREGGIILRNWQKQQRVSIRQNWSCGKPKMP